MFSPELLMDICPNHLASQLLRIRPRESLIPEVAKGMCHRWLGLARWGWGGVCVCVSRLCVLAMHPIDKKKKIIVIITAITIIIINNNNNIINNKNSQNKNNNTINTNAYTFAYTSHSQA